jgi:hypothetical protein
MPKTIKLKTKNERLITASGVVLFANLLEKTDIKTKINTKHPYYKQKDNRRGKRETYSNYDCIMSYISILTQGKIVYDDISELHEDEPFYCAALGIQNIPSPETLRQRLDDIGHDFEAFEIDPIMEESAAMLRNNGMLPTPIYTDHVPLDVDVTVHDNSKTKKEGVGHTYMKIDGYSPIYAYFGDEGYACNVVLRNGETHSQKGTVEFMTDTIKLAKSVTPNKLLVRMDSGFDAIDNIILYIKEDVDYIIKRNLRKEKLEMWLGIARNNPDTVMVSPREGKTVYIGSTFFKRKKIGQIKVAYRVTVRLSDSKGQQFIEPNIEVDTWWTSLSYDPHEVIQLYNDHGTSEQFHSEIKSDIGIERFPSGKFATNALIIKLAALAYNILKVIGIKALDNDDDYLTKREVRRLRIKTIIKRLIFIAGHVTTHARQMFLSLGISTKWRAAFARVYAAFT